MKADQQEARLKEIDSNYRAQHIAAHAEYNAAFDAAMKRHGLKIENLQSVQDFPIEFHEDEELVAARDAFLAKAKAAREGKDSSVQSLPRPRLKFIRTARIG